MPERLKSALRSHKGSLLVLVLKAAAFSFLLYLSPDYWFFLLIALVAALFFYFRPLFNSSQLLSSFSILLAIALLVSRSEILQESSWFLVAAVALGILFASIIGIKNLIFVKREPFYYFLNGFLFLLVFIFFFSSRQSDLFFLKYLLAGFTTFLLGREFLMFNLGGSEDVLRFTALSKRNLMALVFGSLMLQALWAIAILPLGFLNAASLALLIALVLEDFFIEHWNGSMSRQIILRNITLFLVLTLMILGTSRWSP